MKTLHEMAVKLQESIIKQQDDAHNSTSINYSKYNNLKLKMDSRYNYPHVIITIGISEAIFNIQEGTKTDGSLGPDERYVKKWLNAGTIVSDLKEIYIAMGDLVKPEEINKAISQEGEADEVKKDAPKRKQHKQDLPMDSETNEGAESEIISPPNTDIKNYLKSMFKGKLF